MGRWVLLALIAGCLHGVPDELPETKPPTPEPVPPPPVEGPVIGPLGPGPLARELSSPGEAVKRAVALALDRDRKRPLTRDQVIEDAAVLEHVVDAYAANVGDVIQLRGQALHEVRTLRQPMLAIQLYGIVETSLRAVAIYVQPGGITQGAFTWPAPEPAAGGTHEWFEPTPGVVELAIRDLTSPWQLELGRLRAANAIVIDLQTARGSDPRPLVPWLEEITGRAPLAPLRAIERPADADGFVAAYAARFAVETRDRAVWDALVGTMPAAKSHRAMPITVVVGRGCEAACELAARVLETYAGARVYGSVTEGGRLAHDEPARVVLPHSKLQVSFFATTYRLAAEIERKTGATELWPRRRIEEGDFALDYALRDADRRLRGGWPRCDALAWVATPQLLSPALRAKLDSPESWTKCKGVVNVVVIAKAPESAVRELVGSCGLADLQVVRGGGSAFHVMRGSAIPFGVIAQLAASPLVDRVSVACVQRLELL